MALKLTNSIGRDPSPSTAYGTCDGLKAAASHRLRRDSLDGVRAAIQGMGSVGFHSAKLEAALRALLVVKDNYHKNLERALESLDAEAFFSQAIYDQDVDAFSPCAMGLVINKVRSRKSVEKLARGHAQHCVAKPGDFTSQVTSLNRVSLIDCFKSFYDWFYIAMELNLKDVIALGVQLRQIPHSLGCW